MHVLQIALTALILVRFSIRNHHWKAGKLYFFKNLCIVYLCICEFVYFPRNSGKFHFSKISCSTVFISSHFCSNLLGKICQTEGYEKSHLHVNMRKKVTCEKSYDLKIQMKSAVFTHESLQLNRKFISLLAENTFLQLTSKKGWISGKIFMLFRFVKGR